MNDFNIFNPDLAWSAVLGGESHPNTVSYIQAQFEPSLLEQQSLLFRNAGKQIIDYAKDLYTQFTGSAAMQFARKAVSSVASFLRPDTVCYIADITEFQKAQPVMQRYLMAEPSIRKAWQSGLIDGYSATYIDNDPDAKDHRTYDWCRINDGMVTIEEDGSAYHTHYVQQQMDNDIALTFHKKVDILDSQLAAKAWLEMGLADPTSAEGDSM